MKKMFLVIWFIVGINCFGQTDKITSMYNDTLTVGTSIVQLPSHSNAKWIQLMHNHATAIVYYGGFDVSSITGFGALSKLDTTELYPVQNTNVIYVVSDTPGVVLRILWGF